MTRLHLLIRSSRPRTPGGVWAWACSGACAGVLGALLVLAPARWLAEALHQLSGGHLQLSQTEGTVWAGSARLTLTGSTGSRDAVSLPGRVRWQVRPGWDHLVLEAQAACCTQQPIAITVTPRWQHLGLALADSESTWPAGIFSGLGAPWNTVQLEGELVVASRGWRADLSAGQVRFDGALQLEARDLRSHLSSLRPMGSYRLTLAGGATPTLQLETLRGSLLLSGRGQWRDGHLRFDGSASAVPAHEAELSNLLNVIGRREGTRSVLSTG